METEINTKRFTPWYTYRFEVEEIGPSEKSPDTHHGVKTTHYKLPLTQTTLEDLGAIDRPEFFAEDIYLLMFNNRLHPWYFAKTIFLNLRTTNEFFGLTEKNRKLYYLAQGDHGVGPVPHSLKYKKNFNAVNAVGHTSCTDCNDSWAPGSRWIWGLSAPVEVYSYTEERENVSEMTRRSGVKNKFSFSRYSL